MILELDNVELYFKSKPILTSIYLQAKSGDITTIIGRNGSGKSSLLRIVFGDLNPKYKLIRLDSEPVLKPLYTLGNIKLLPEFSFCPKNMRIKTAFKHYEVSWEEFQIVFNDVTIRPDQKFKELSTGEKRLVEAFLILKSESQIILLDEPLKSLSPIAAEKLKALITKERDNKLIIIADHQTEHWNPISDQIYELANGALKLTT